MLKTPCIEWQGGRDRDGYGTTLYQGKKQRAHRVAWQRIHGPIPDGLNVLHKCDNPPCVNVGHLFLGTQRRNVEDMMAKGRGGGFLRR